MAEDSRSKGNLFHYYCHRYYRVFLLGMAVAAVASSPLELAAAEETAKKCGPFESWEVGCEVSVNYGETFHLDCMETHFAVQPQNLLDSKDANRITVCKSPVKRTSSQEQCLYSNTALLSRIPGITVQSHDGYGWTIKAELTGPEDLHIQGGCSMGERSSGFFNATLRTSSTSTAVAPDTEEAEAQNGGAYSTAAAGLFASAAAAMTGLLALGLCV